MELNRKVLVQVAVMLFLVGITATVEARFDARSFIKEVLPNADANYYFVKSTTTDLPCICNRPWPIYTCWCSGEVCEPACSGTCICVVNAITGSRDCKCAKEDMFFPGAAAHKV